MTRPPSCLVPSDVSQIAGKKSSDSVEPWLIAIAASAGGIQAMNIILAALPADLPASIVVVEHRTPSKTSSLEQILARSARVPVETADEHKVIRPCVVYVARSDLHLTIAPTREFSYVDGTRVRGVLSSANPLFESAAAAFKNRMIAVVLTGSGTDATDGVQRVKAHGGTVIAQDPATAQFFSMPSAAIKTGAVDYVLPVEAIAPALAAIVRGEIVDDRGRTEA